MKTYLRLLLMNVMLITPLVRADTQPTQANKPVVLNKFLQFILTAPIGSVTISGSKGELMLKNVSANVTYFTNRPRRITSTMTTAFFLKRWIKPPPHDFTTTPPNAALVFTDDKHAQQYTNVVILQNPQYDASQNTLRFSIQLLDSAWRGPTTFKQITLTMAEVTVCGVLGAWGNLPGEPQSDANCHLGKD